MNYSAQSPIVRLNNVSKSFRSNGTRTQALSDISLEAVQGELLLLLGPSGSGKTTLLTVLAGLLESTEGSVELFGRPISQYNQDDLQALRARHLGFIFQNFLLIDALTALENIRLVLQFAGRGKSETTAKSLNVLSHLELLHLSDKYPSGMSQGEKQRVAIARACANDAELLLADEPTACLESSQGMVIIRLLARCAKDQGRCVIIASHDLRLCDYADRIIHLRDGMIVDG
ncbi:MAG: ABC transporter ATP-binding protein [bacterium]